MAEVLEHLPHLELICFGAPTARLDGQDPPSEVLWRKHLALLSVPTFSPAAKPAIYGVVQPMTS